MVTLMWKHSPQDRITDHDRSSKTVRTDLRCVYTEYDEIFRTYSDVGYETIRGYDVKLRHYPRHSRIQS